MALLRHQGMRITPVRRILLQLCLDQRVAGITTQSIYKLIEKKLPGVDRSSVYRNLEIFKKLELIQELNLPNIGKRVHYVFDRKLHHYYICKVCGKINQGNEKLFRKIEAALKDIHGFKNGNLSMVFYGWCRRCLG